MQWGIHVTKIADNNIAESLILIKKLFNKDKLYFNTAQIFITGPKSYTMIPLLKSLDGREELKKITVNLKIQLYIHGSYVDFPWTGNIKAISNIRKELKLCKQIGAKALIIHLPKAPISNIIDNLPKLLKNKPKQIKLILETNAVCPAEGKSYETPAKLNPLLEYIYKTIVKVDGKSIHLKNHIGICVDTAHIWACGVNISSRRKAENWLKNIKYPQLIKLIHLNDDANKLKSGRDVHTHLGTGQIWKQYSHDIKKSGIYPFVKFAQKSKIPIILERHFTNQKYIDLVKEIKFMMTI